MPDLRVAIYARQSVAEDQGIRQQLDDCQSEASRRGWPVVTEFVDNDTSGSSLRGPKTQWSAMLRAFDDGAFDTLLVNDADRLTRSLTDVLEVRPPKRDMRVVVVRGNIDTADDDYMLKQLVLVAEREVRLKTLRAQRYALERRKAGHPTSGKTPHGYRWVPADKRDALGTRFEVDPTERQDVRRIFDEFLSGASLGQIARDLTAAGRLTRSGARWHTSTVRRVLMNPFYAALLPPAQPSGQHDLAGIVIEACTPGAWPAIVTLDELLAARARLVGVKPNHDGTARKWLLAGIAICSVCREPVRSARGETHPTARKDGTGSAPSTRYHTYRCVNGHFMRNGDIVDELVAELCIRRIAESDASELFGAEDDWPDIPALHAQRTALEGRRSAIASLIAKGLLTERDAEQDLAGLATEIRAVNDQLAQAVQLSPLADLASVGDAHVWWAQATLARRRAVIDALMTVAIRPVGMGKRVTTLDAAIETVEITWRGQPL